MADTAAAAIIANVAKEIIGGIPEFIEMVRSGRNAGDIKLSEFISTDAVQRIDGSIRKSKAFEDKFQPG